MYLSGLPYCIFCAISEWPLTSNSSLLMKMAIANDSCVNLFLWVQLLKILNLIYATGSWTIIIFLGHCWRWCCPPSWVYAPAAWASSTSQCEYLWQCLNSHGDYMSSWGNLHDLFLLHRIVLSVSYYSLIWRTFGHLSHACVVIDSALSLRFWLDPPVVLLFV